MRDGDDVLESGEHDPRHDGHVGADGEAVAVGPPLAVLDAVPHVEKRELSLPTHSTRGTAPGLRGCWATNKRGDPCGAARRADGDYCNAHSGHGVAEDPARWAVVGAAKNNEIRRRRATLRLALGHTRLNTPRGLLKAAVYAQAEAVAEAALSPILDSTPPSVAKANLAMALIREVEPTVQATVSVALPDDPEGVDGLSLSALLSLAQEHGIAPPQADPAS
jgi:hypothetical protein